MQKDQNPHLPNDLLVEQVVVEEFSMKLQISQLLMNFWKDQLVVIQMVEKMLQKNSLQKMDQYQTDLHLKYFMVFCH